MCEQFLDRQNRFWDIQAIGDTCNRRWSNVSLGKCLVIPENRLG